MCREEIGWECLGWVGLTGSEQVAGFCESGNEPWSSAEGGVCVD
jgi:hypothetical protein